MWTRYDSKGNPVLTQGKTTSVNEFNVMDYGAKGDGTTDDTTAIQATMTAAANGGSVYFPAGTYIVSSTIILPANNCNIYGVNKGKSVISSKTTFTTGDVFQCQSGGDNVNIYSLGFTSQSATARTSGATINVNSCHDMHISDIIILYPYIGIAVQTGAYKTYINNFDIKVPTALTTSANSAGILVNNGAVGDTYISDGNIESASGAGKCAYGIRIITTGYAQIERCALTASDVGLAIMPAALNEVAINIFAAKVLCDTNGTTGLVLSTTLASNKIRQVRFTDCWFSGSVAGNGILQTVTLGVQDDISFFGCRILSNNQNGYLNAGAGIASLTNLSFVGCDIGGNSTAGSGTYHGLNFIATTGNFLIKACKAGSMDTFPSNQGYGIYLATGTSPSYMIMGNDVRGNVTGGIFDGGSNTGFNQKVNENNIGGAGEGQIYAYTGAGITFNANANTIVAGGANACPVPKGSIKAGDSFRATVNFTATGTATATAIQVHVGTNGTTADTVILTASVTGAVGTTRGRAVLEFTFTSTTAVIGTYIVEQTGTTGLSNAAVTCLLATPAAATTNVDSYLTISFLTASSGSSGTVNTSYIERL